MLFEFVGCAVAQATVGTLRVVLDAKLVDQEELSQNRDNLEARLVGLGLVRRLSDSCSFVENPFAFKGETAC